MPQIGLEPRPKRPQRSRKKKSRASAYRDYLNRSPQDFTVEVKHLEEGEGYEVTIYNKEGGPNSHLIPVFSVHGFNRNRGAAVGALLQELRSSMKSGGNLTETLVTAVEYRMKGEKSCTIIPLQDMIDTLKKAC